MSSNRESVSLSRRGFLHTLSAIGGAALASGALAACQNRGSMVGRRPSVHLLWSDVTQAYAPLLDDFSQATGIKVQQSIVPYGQRLDKINIIVLGQGDFDVIQMDTVWTPQFAAAGWVDDLTDRIPEVIKGDIPASSLSAVMYHGRLYGMPLFNSAKHLFYNEKLLMEAGFDHPPQTLDEFVAQAQATTSPGHWGSIWAWRQAEGLLCDWLAIMFSQSGAQFVDDHGNLVFNTRGGTKALQWMVDLLYTHKAADPASLESSEDDVRKALLAGTYALTSNWEGVLPEANDPAQSRAAPYVRVALLPGRGDTPGTSVSGSEGWAILAHAKRKDTAWTLLEYMASPRWQKKAAIITGNYPTLASLYADAELRQRFQDFSIYGDQFRYLVVRPQLVNYTQISDIVQKHLHRALLQQVSPKGALDAAVDEGTAAAVVP